MGRPMASLSSCILVAIGCAPAPVLTDSERAALREAVNMQVMEFWSVWRQADFDRGIAFYDDHPDFSFAAGGDTWSSRASIDSAFRPVFETIQSQNLRVDETRVAPVSRDLVYVTQRLTATQVHTGGTTSPTVQVAFTALWVRADGEWKVRFAHHSQRDAP